MHEFRQNIDKLQSQINDKQQSIQNPSKFEDLQTIMESGYQFETDQHKNRDLELNTVGNYAPLNLQARISYSKALTARTLKEPKIVLSARSHRETGGRTTEKSIKEKSRNLAVNNVALRRTEQKSRHDTIQSNLNMDLKQCNSLESYGQQIKSPRKIRKSSVQKKPIIMRDSNKSRNGEVNGIEPSKGKKYVNLRRNTLQDQSLRIDHIQSNIESVSYENENGSFKNSSTEVINNNSFTSQRELETPLSKLPENILDLEKKDKSRNKRPNIGIDSHDFTFSQKEGLVTATIEEVETPQEQIYWTPRKPSKPQTNQKVPELHLSTKLKVFNQGYGSAKAKTDRNSMGFANRKPKTWQQFKLK